MVQRVLLHICWLSMLYTRMVGKQLVSIESCQRTQLHSDYIPIKSARLLKWHCLERKMTELIVLVFSGL